MHYNRHMNKKDAPKTRRITFNLVTKDLIELKFQAHKNNMSLSELIYAILLENDLSLKKDQKVNRNPNIDW